MLQSINHPNNNDKINDAISLNCKDFTMKLNIKLKLVIKLNGIWECALGFAMLMFKRF